MAILVSLQKFKSISKTRIKDFSLHLEEFEDFSIHDSCLHSVDLYQVKALLNSFTPYYFKDAVSNMKTHKENLIVSGPYLKNDVKLFLISATDIKKWKESEVELYKNNECTVSVIQAHYELIDIIKELYDQNKNNKLSKITDDDAKCILGLFLDLIDTKVNKSHTQKQSKRDYKILFSEFNEIFLQYEATQKEFACKYHDYILKEELYCKLLETFELGYKNLIEYYDDDGSPNSICLKKTYELMNSNINFISYYKHLCVNKQFANSINWNYISVSENEVSRLLFNVFYNISNFDNIFYDNHLIFIEKNDEKYFPSLITFTIIDYSKNTIVKERCHKSIQNELKKIECNSDISQNLLPYCVLADFGKLNRNFPEDGKPMITKAWADIDKKNETYKIDKENKDIMSIFSKHLRFGSTPNFIKTLEDRNE